MKKIAFVLAMLILLNFTSCKINTLENFDTSSNPDNATDAHTVVSQSEYYIIKSNENFTYDFCVYDKKGNELISVKNISRCPNIEMIDENIVSVVVQSGTGRSTNIAHYYDIETGRVSDTYQYVIGTTSDKVVYVEFDKAFGYSLIVSKMFDKKEQIISVELDDVYAIDPIVSEMISENMIEVVYLKGEEYVETKIKINLETGLYSKE